jgi:NitT/TauT family transport system ATP-binding protein
MTEAVSFQAAAVQAAGGAAVEIRGVSIDYSDEFGRPAYHALDSVDLSVRAGEFVCLVGQTGCGKSTLLSAIGGLLPASRGEILIGDRPAGKAKLDDRAVVFQAASLMPWRTVLHNVAYGLELSRVPKAERLSRARELIELVGLGSREDAYPHQLSGGMQQRVNLARALAADPRLLLMDEPFGALDAITRQTLQGELLRIWSGSGKTVIFVTHQIDEAVLFADRIVVLAKGPRSRIRGIVEVPIARPRAGKLSSPEAQQLMADVWALIREDPIDAG